MQNASAHYRSPPDFNDKGLRNAEKGLTRIYRLKEKLEELSKDADVLNEKDLSGLDKKYFNDVNDFKRDFESAMDDDFNTPQAIAVIFEFVNKSNKYLEGSPNSPLSKYALDMLVSLGKVLTLFQPKEIKSDVSDDSLLADIQKILVKTGKKTDEKDVAKLLDLLLELREEARKNKDWGLADNIRDDLKQIGFEIQDTADGPVWRKMK